MSLIKAFPELAPVHDHLLTMFDEPFYRRRAARLNVPVSEDALEHYIQEGWTKGLDPHPLFSTQYYRSQNEDVAGAGVNPLAHYAGFGAAEQRAFHPLFDTKFYLDQLEDPATADPNLLVDYLSRPVQARPDIHVLLDRDYCATQMQLTAEDDAALHYLGGAFLDGVWPHRLFDTQNYLRVSPQLRTSETEPLGHYVSVGWRQSLDPHPLFESAHYIVANLNGLATEVCPLVHYVENCTLQSLEVHPLFSRQYYLDAVAEAESERSVTERTDLLADYLEIGWREGLSPTAFFDPEYYEAQAGLSDFEPHGPLYHFLAEGFRQCLDPHPAFDTEHYLRQRPNVRAGSCNAILEFLRTGRDIAPFALFDINHYVHIHSDVRDTKSEPGKHFIEFGMAENRGINALISHSYLFAQNPEESFAEDHFLRQYRVKDFASRTRLLFVGHEASRTGAPLILLNIVRYFASLANVECITILNGEGPLVDEFTKVSHVYIMHTRERKFLDLQGPNSANLKAEVNRVLKLFVDNPPVGCFANSAEVRHLATEIAQSGIPVISLIHEMGEFYREPQIRHISDSSKIVIFPSNSTRESHIARYPGIAGNSEVLGQGLMDRRLGLRPPRKEKDQLCSDLSIPPHALIVLGCGTPDLRKGIDIFVNVATAALSALSDDHNVHFVWLGGDGGRFGDYVYWLKQQLSKAGLEHKVHFVAAKKDVTPYFAASDVFLLSSRADPYPCVVHEAMACGLPVVTFEESGGAAESVGDTGAVLKGFDLADMTQGLVELLSNAQLRSEKSRLAKARAQSVFDFDRYTEELAEKMISIQSKPAVLGPRRKRAEKKIIFTNPDWGISGVNTFTENLISHLVDAGYQTELAFTMGRFTALEDTEQLPDVPIHFLQPEQAHEEAIWSNVQDHLSENAPCIFVPNYDYIASTISANLASDVGIVGILHSDDVEHYEHVNRLGRYWNRIVAVSNRILDETLQINPSFEGRSSVIHYGIPIKPGTPQRFASDSDGKTEKPIRLLYAGRLVQRQKRILDFAALATYLDRQNFEFEMILAGEGEHKEALERKLATLPSKSSVLLPGRIPHAEMGEQYENADVFMLLSDFEGLPLSVLEAMERGCIPVVSEMDSGIPELIEHGVNGFVFPKGDFEACHRILHELQENPQMRQDIARAARDTVKKKFSTDVMGKKYGAIFDEVFEEILSGTYRRPKPLLINPWNSDGDVFLPPPFITNKPSR